MWIKWLFTPVFWVKVGDTSLYFFIRSNSVIVCAETSVSWFNVNFFLQDAAGLVSRDHRRSVPAQAYLGICYWIETCSMQHHNCSTSCYCYITFLYIWSLLWKVRVLFCLVFLCLTQHIRAESFLDPSVVKLILQCFERNRSHSLFISGRKLSSCSFSNGCKRLVSCQHFPLR